MAPKKLKGYFTMLPVYWTSGENNHPGEMSVMRLPQRDSIKIEVSHA
jgi:hypothetical protein